MGTSTPSRRLNEPNRPSLRTLPLSTPRLSPLCHPQLNLARHAAHNMNKPITTSGEVLKQMFILIGEGRRSQGLMVRVVLQFDRHVSLQEEALEHGCLDP